MRALTFTLRNALELPNRRGLASTRRRAAALVAERRRTLAWEVASLLAGQRPEAPLPFVKVTVFRHSRGEPDEDNLHAAVKDLLDVLQPAGPQRTFGLGLIENDGRKHCFLRVLHVPARSRPEQMTRVTIVESTADDVAQAYERLRAAA